MKFEDFLKMKKEHKEEHKKDFLEQKKEAIKHLDNCEEALILVTENGSLLCGSRLDITSALTCLFANLMSEKTYSKEELLKCVKVAELLLTGDLEKIADDLEKIHDLLGD